MADSLRASEKGLEIIDKARKLKGWTRLNSAAWWQEAYGSRSTLQRFWKRNNITKDKFIAICEAVGIKDWEKIAEAAIVDISLLPTDIQAALIQQAENGPIQFVTETSTDQDELSEGHITPLRGWEKAPNLDRFFGREAELQQLQQWVKDGCKLITILGMGGIGKTSLVVALADDLQNDFDLLIWYSLQDAPPLEILLTDIAPLLTEQVSTHSLTNAAQTRSLLLNYLHNHRCLLVLDNVESILAGRDSPVAGRYRSGYENYEPFLRQIAEGRHQSCLLLTSREQPQGLIRLAGDKVRCLRLEGLAVADGWRVLQNIPSLSTQHGQTIVKHYGGNPLALKIVAAGIQDIPQGDTAYFLNRLQQGGFPFSDIQDLLERHTERLSEREREVLFWLAIVREPISPSELESCLLSVLSRQELPSTLESLQRRSLFVITGMGYTLQPVVMEYLIHHFVTAICVELELYLQQSEFQIQKTYLNSYALMQATAKDYVRETQIRLIVKPILEATGQLFQRNLKSLLDRLQRYSPSERGYCVGNLLNLAIQMGLNLTGFDFSRLFIRQAYLRGVELHQVNFTDADLQQVIFSETMSNVLSIAFHSDGQTLATVDTKGWLYLWDIQTDRQLLSTKAHLEWIFAVAFSPNGQMLATAGLDWSVKLWHWDGQQLSLQRTLAGHEIGVAAVAFSPDSSLLASASADKTVKLWDVESGECLHTLKGHDDIARTIAFSQDGRILATGSWDCTIQLWDVERGQNLRILKGHDGPVESIAVTALPSLPDVLVSGSYDQTVKLWNLHTGECIRTLQGHRDRLCAVTCATVTSDSMHEKPQILIASAGDDGTIRLWDGRSGDCVKILFAGKERIWALAFSPQGKFLASGSQDRLFKLWDVQTGQCWKTVQGAENEITPFGFSCNAEILYTYGYQEQHLLHWNWKTGRRLKALPIDMRAGMDTRLSPSGQAMAVGGYDHTVKVFDLETGKCLQELRGHQGWVRTVAFSGDGQLLASGSGDCTARIWNVAAGSCHQVIKGHISPVQCVVFSPDATLLATGSWDQTVRLWDLQTGQLISILEGHSHRVEDVVFSRDGTLLYSCSLDQTIRIWQVATGDCIEVWQQLGDGVVCLDLSPDGNLLASANYRGEVRIRQLPQGIELSVLEANLIYGIVVFASDSQTIAIRSAQGSCKLYNAITGQCLQTLQVPRLYEETNMTGVTGLTQAQRETLEMLGAII